MMGSAGSGTAKVDPACAVCQAPASQLCGCEAHALEVALFQAEDLYFPPTMRNVRSWVRRNARDYILGYFHTLSEPCKDAYALHLDTIKATCLARSGPSSPGSGSGSGSNNNNNNNNNTNVHVARARVEYRRNIDRAWALAVKRYPEVLNHFYSLVRITLPDDDDPVMKRVPGFDRPPKGGDPRHRADRRKPPVRSRYGHTPPSPQFPAPLTPTRGPSFKGPPAPPPPPPQFSMTPPSSFKAPPPMPYMPPPPPPPHIAHWQTPPPSPP
ncbi:hypothetical protein BBO_06327 [Beauveria brongniartii RCEF 3172]|uniref:Serine/threonine protein phosphatase n=1 Tax=Beauveria brongniartii RCEF 3172 TaxID=1081107 RepID=A0A167B9G2_9HYPO|nr:hypothetical protein BBO_06327 [Beauveria brongniartii RCEF 3172]